MRIPAFILEHPVESLIAGVLLLTLAFGSADRHAAAVAQTATGAPQTIADKM
ncbi:MAG TPA: hypothetical protein VGC16_10575 [Rhizomicrobium sp.]